VERSKYCTVPFYKVQNSTVARRELYQVRTTELKTDITTLPVLSTPILSLELIKDARVTDRR
jgi:hypothetical protein